MKVSFLNEFSTDLINCIVSNSIQLDNEKIGWKFNSNNEEMYLNGFGHGSSGIISCLNQFNNTKSYELSRLLKQIMNFDLSFYDEGLNIYCDGRFWNEKKMDSITWCHGSTGIALSRIIMLNDGTIIENVNENTLKNEITIIGEKIFKDGLNIDSMQLCHGILSNAEILKAIGFAIENDDFIKKSNMIVNEISEKILNNPDLLFQGKNILNYGLFTGISGIGYQMLRFYDWKRVNSIIALESPSQSYSNNFLH